MPVSRRLAVACLFAVAACRDAHVSDVGTATRASLRAPALEFSDLPVVVPGAFSATISFGGSTMPLGLMEPDATFGYAAQLVEMTVDGVTYSVRRATLVLPETRDRDFDIDVVAVAMDGTRTALAPVRVTRSTRPDGSSSWRVR